MKIKIFFFLFCLISVAACKKDQEITASELAEIPIDQQTVDQRLATQLWQTLHPLAATDPLEWTNEEMNFWDKLADKNIVGLGESTHGTSEFFKAKHRLFQYLVEQHDFKVFAFEADFGESIFINKAIQEGRAEDIKGLMLEYMQFWTWRTEEVLDLLVWMANYNKGKAPEDKVHYVGVDCQLNSFNAQWAIDYFERYDKELFEKAEQTLLQIERETSNYYNIDLLLNDNLHAQLIEELLAIITILKSKKTELIAASSIKEYEFQKQLLEVVRQSFKVSYNYRKNGFEFNLRDTYMAQNTMWLHDTYFDNAKVVLWAHNYHVSATDVGPSMGQVISNNYNDDYHIVGFTFATGEFTAMDYNGTVDNGLSQMSIKSKPIKGSINSIFTKMDKDNFAVNLSDLVAQSQWTSLFLSEDPTILNIGSIYTDTPEVFYEHITSSQYHDLIHIDNTTAATQLIR